MNNPTDSRAWEIVKNLNEALRAAQPAIDALSARKLLAEYFQLHCARPSRLHSAILSCAVKMTTVFPDFHFVPFLEMWGLENLRQEDSEAQTDDNGHRFPSLAERMTKAYAYSLLFHPDERIAPDMESMMLPTLQRKGYLVADDNGRMKVTTSAIATHVFTSDVRNRKMTFVQFLLPDGEEVVTEVHTVTAYSKMRYEEIMGRQFLLILRNSENGKIRIEAAKLQECGWKDFPLKVGYVEHIDSNHKHIHVYDNESRHFVSKYQQTNLTVGQYVEFLPVIPKVGNFKTAMITRVVENGQEAFGYRDAVVTFSSEEQGYCSWELLPDADGTVHAIVETGAKDVQEPATKGYINKQLLDTKQLPLPKKGDKVRIITFLKRGKDGKKKPVVVDFK